MRVTVIDVNIDLDQTTEQVGVISDEVRAEIQVLMDATRAVVAKRKQKADAEAAAKSARTDCLESLRQSLLAAGDDGLPQKAILDMAVGSFTTMSALCLAMKRHLKAVNGNEHVLAKKRKFGNTYYYLLPFNIEPTPHAAS